MKKELSIKTADGVAPGWLYSPENGKGIKGGVLFYMDAMGPRQSMDIMAQRLADNGYLVLLPDLFYRFGSYGPYSGNSFAQEESRTQLMKMITGTTQEMTARDAESFLKIFDGESLTGRLGIVGYCMGGGRALTAAGRYPDRFAAAASFHGGNLASDAPDSPHLLADRIKARIYVGTAGVDNSFPAEQSTRLAQVLRDAGVDFALESYVGVQHGWTVPDRDGVYNEKAAERHWNRLLQLLDETI